MWQTKPYRDTIALQRLITDACPNASAKDLAALGKTFVCLETLKLRLRMKGPPKAVDVQKQVKTKAKPVQPSED